jgi:DNA-binding NarL/FixJ family response regulator
MDLLNLMRKDFSWVTPFVTAKENYEATKRLSRLSSRERELLSLILLYKSSQEIADLWGVKLSTVRSYKRSLYNRLGKFDFDIQETLIAYRPNL